MYLARLSDRWAALQRKESRPAAQVDYGY
jgi:hypothetical protein